MEMLKDLANLDNRQIWGLWEPVEQTVRGVAIGWCVRIGDLLIFQRHPPQAEFPNESSLIRVGLCAQL